MPELDCVGSDRQLNSSSLHKQARRNPLSRHVYSAVEYHDLVPSLQNNPTSQAHSRVPECDGRRTVQVESDPNNRMVTSSVVHSSCRPFCLLFEPQASLEHVSSPRPTYMGYGCSEHKLVGSHSLGVPLHGSP